MTTSQAAPSMGEAFLDMATTRGFAQSVAEINAALLQVIAEQVEAMHELREEVGELKSTIADRRRKADWLSDKEPIPYGHNNVPLLTTEQAAAHYGYTHKQSFVDAMRKRGITPRRVNARRFLWDRATIDAELNAPASRVWGT